MYVDDFWLYLWLTLAMLQTGNPTAQWIASVYITPDRSQIEFLVLFLALQLSLLSCFMLGISGTQVLSLEMCVFDDSFSFLSLHSQTLSPCSSLLNAFTSLSL